MAAAQLSNKTSRARVGRFALQYGFEIVLVVVVVFYTLTAPHFLTLTNIMSLLHAAAPMMIIAAGLSLVIFTGRLDISVGSTAFLTTAVATILLVRNGFSPLAVLAIALVMGFLIGALNGFIVSVLRINPFITTLGTMVALRGAGLELTKSTNISLPEDIRRLSNTTIGPVFVDFLIALAIMLIVHIIHQRTAFGRQLMAIGNDSTTASRLGVRINRVTFMSFALAGLLAAAGGVMTVVQVGSSSGSIGQGLEFTGISVIVLGGVSLFGGEGKIIPGVLRGVLMLEIIRNGLNQIGADPYAYRFVNGAIIFIAMYADSLRSRLPAEVRTFEAEEPVKAT